MTHIEDLKNIYLNKKNKTSSIFIKVSEVDNQYIFKVEQLYTW